MSLLDVFTGGKSSEASADLDKALAAIQQIQSPTPAEMQYKLQQLVQAGILTPEQAQTYLQSPNAMLSENIDQTGTQAQQQSIAQLLDAAKNGGLNPAEQAAMQNIIQQLNTQEKGANDAIVQNQAARGALTGGETMAAQLAENQSADVNANELASQEAGQAYTQLLNELTSAGTAGEALQGQENTQANTVASATNAINQFNAAQQQQEANFNTQNTNAAQEFNLENAQNIENQNVANENQYAQYQAQLPQEVFSDEMEKAAAEAGVSENQAKNDTTQGGQMAGLIGGALGTAGQVATDAFAPAQTPAPVKTSWKGGPVDMEEGGDVPDDGLPSVRGDSPKNDRIPALLSPHEVVLPRSVAQNPRPDRVMEFLNRMRKPKTPHPADVATTLRALQHLREVG